MLEPVGESATPGEIALRADLAGTKVQLGEENGRWRVLRLAWPYLYVAFAAAARASAPTEYVVQFDCTRYRSAPRAVFWDEATGAQFAAGLWPVLRGDQAFRTDWQPCGRTCFYLACDGDTQPSKTQWQSEHAMEWWGASSDITLYFEVIHVRLHSSRYLGSSRTPSAAAG